jgi:hypothetical protein
VDELEAFFVVFPESTFATVTPFTTMHKCISREQL